MLQGSESNIQLLLGHYAHSMGCFRESALHFMQASKVNLVLAFLEVSFGTFSECTAWSFGTLEQFFLALHNTYVLSEQYCRKASQFNDCTEIGCTISDDFPSLFIF
jgi:hypothetical protein